MNYTKLVEELYRQYQVLKALVDRRGYGPRDKKDLKALKRVIRYNSSHADYKAMKF